MFGTPHDSVSRHLEGSFDKEANFDHARAYPKFSEHPNQHNKKSERLNFGDYPSVAQFPQWKRKVRMEVCCASDDPATAQRWMLETEDQKIPISELAGRPHGQCWSHLDMRIGQAVYRMCRGDTAIKLGSMLDDADKKGTFLSGRQMLRVLYDEFAGSMAHAQHNVVSQIQSLRCSRGSSGLAKYMIRWDDLMGKLQSPIGDDIKASWLSSAIQDSGELRLEMNLLSAEIIQQYDSGMINHTWHYNKLLSLVRAHIRNRKMLEIDSAKMREYSGGDRRDVALASQLSPRRRMSPKRSKSPKGKGRGKQRSGTSMASASPQTTSALAANPKELDCYQWLRGNCTFGPKCKYKHDPSKKGKTSRSQSPASSGRGSSASSGRGRQPVDRDGKSIVCRMFNSAKGCRFGNKCKFVHSRNKSGTNANVSIEDVALPALFELLDGTPAIAQDNCDINKPSCPGHKEAAAHCFVALACTSEVHARSLGVQEVQEVQEKVEVGYRRSRFGIRRQQQPTPQSCKAGCDDALVSAGMSKWCDSGPKPLSITGTGTGELHTGMEYDDLIHFNPMCAGTYKRQMIKNEIQNKTSERHLNATADEVKMAVRQANALQLTAKAETTNGEIYAAVGKTQQSESTPTAKTLYCESLEKDNIKCGEFALPGHALASRGNKRSGLRVSFSATKQLIKYPVWTPMRPLGKSAKSLETKSLVEISFTKRDTMRSRLAQNSAIAAAKALYQEVSTGSVSGDSGQDHALVARWVVDTGSGHHLVSAKTLSKNAPLQKSSCRYRLTTANGSIETDLETQARLPQLDDIVEPLVLADTPNVLSVGRLVREQGYSLEWHAESPDAPTLTTPSGTRVTLTVVNDVPVLPVQDVTDEYQDTGLVQEGLEAQEFSPSETKHVDVLKAEAHSLGHLSTHTPFNPYCESCSVGKLKQKPARRKPADHDNRLEADNFGDCVRMDHVVLREATEGIQGERNALVVQDVATGFLGFYPAKDRSVETCAEAVKSFLGTSSLKMLHSDNAREFIALAKEMDVPHSTSTPYRHQANANIERQIGLVVQLARVLIHQSGIRLAGWPLAGSHAAFLLNNRDDKAGGSAWQRRFGSACNAALWPFGARIFYRDPHVEDLHKFAPLGEEGIFLGFHLNPGAVYRGDHIVTNLAKVLENNQSQWPMVRTREVRLPDVIVFPLKDARSSNDEDRRRKVQKKHSSTDVDLEAPGTMCDPDSEEIVEPKTKTDTEDDFVVRNKDIVLKPTRWTGYQASTSHKLRSDLIPPKPRKGSLRPAWLWPDEWSSMHKNERSLYLRQVYRPSSAEEASQATKESSRMAECDHDVQLRNEGGDDASGVSSRATHGTSQSDQVACAANRFTHRSRKSHDSNLPKRRMKSPTFSRLDSVSQEAGVEYADGHFYANPGIGISEIELNHAEEACPAEQKHEEHREKLVPPTVNNWLLVTRQIKPGSDEFRSEACRKALFEELDKLRKAKVWNEDTVVEYATLQRQTERDGKPILIGRLFPIVGLKHAELSGVELPPGSPTPKYKGRIVFDGRATHVKATTGQSPIELYTEISQTPATMTAVRIAVAYASLRGFDVSVRDAQQAYIQASIVRKDKPDTYVRLPRPWWPRSWIGKFNDPACRLLKALYGHPESGAIWQIHLDVRLRALGWEPIPELPSSYRHKEHEALLVVYVDDLLMASHKSHMQGLWAEIDTAVDFAEEHAPLDRFLGTYFSNSESGNVISTKISMDEFMHSAYREFEKETGCVLTPASTPYTYAEPIPEDKDPPGKLASLSAKYLMKVLYGARMARPDLVTCITKMASFVSKWRKSHDSMLVRLLSYVKYSASWGLLGKVARGSKRCELRMYVDADYAADKASTRSYSGLWLELATDDCTFPLAWSCKKQAFTATSSAEAETAALSTNLKKEAWPTQQALERILGEGKIPLRILEDNMQVIQNIKSGYSAALRCISRTFRTSVGVLSEAISTPRLNTSIEYIKTTEQKADTFTKALPRVQFETALDQIGIIRRKTQTSNTRQAQASDSDRQDPDRATRSADSKVTRGCDVPSRSGEAAGRSL